MKQLNKNSSVDDVWVSPGEENIISAAARESGFLANCARH